jgi:hypothetical protein
MMMVNTLKGITKRVSRVFGSIGLNGGQHWPMGVLNQLEINYHLTPDDMLRLGFFRRKMGRRNRNYSLYIYDKFTAFDRRLSVKDIEDIYQVPDLLLYKGSITVDGAVHLSRVDCYADN